MNKIVVTARTRQPIRCVSSCGPRPQEASYCPARRSSPWPGPPAPCPAAIRGCGQPNCPWAPVPLATHADLRHLVNEGLMAVFFFAAGLEIKRELVTGALRDRRAAVLPADAAAGGVSLPALVFTAIVGGGAASAGWSIPMVTGIACAISVLAVPGTASQPGRGCSFSASPSSTTS